VSAEVNKHAVAGTADLQKSLHLVEDPKLSSLLVCQGADVFSFETIVSYQDTRERGHIVSGTLQGPLLVIADADEKCMVFGV
jgi:hypothetical protein